MYPKFSRLRPYYETIMFSLIQLLYWSANCALYSFIVMYLKEQGYTDSMCGVVSGLLACMGIIIHPVAGYVSDTFVTAKKILLVSFAVAIPLTQVLPSLASMGVIFILGLTSLSLFSYYQYSLIDSWIIKLSQTHVDIEFSRIRSFGSLGYGVAALIMGKLIANFGFNAMFYAHSLLLLLAILCIIPMPEVPCTNRGGEGTGKKLSFVEVGKILAKNKEFVVLTISAAVYQFGVRPTSTFMALIIANAGGDSSHLGLSTFIASGMEFPVMLLTAVLLRRVKKTYMMGASFAIVAIRMWLLSMPLPLPVILGMQLVSAMSMGIYISVFTQYIAEITPREITATATTIGTALTFGTGGVLGIFIGGVLSDAFGILGYVRICAILCGVALILFMPNILADLRSKEV